MPLMLMQLKLLKGFVEIGSTLIAIEVCYN